MFLKILSWFFLILLGFTIVRTAFGLDPLYAHSALDVIAQYNATWDSILYDIATAFSHFKGLGDLEWYNAILEILKGIYAVCILPLQASVELADWLLSVFNVFFFGIGQSY